MSSSKRSLQSVASKRSSGCVSEGMPLSKRGKRSSFSGTFNIQKLPFELVMEIFCRLPEESLLRCKSVCKLWNLLIQDQNFIRQHLFKNRSVCYFPLRRHEDIVSCHMHRREYSIKSPLLQLYLPYTREDPTSITMFYAPSSSCHKVGYFYHSKDHSGREFARFEVFRLGVDNSQCIIDIPELQRLDGTKGTFWFMELFIGHVLHIAKMSMDGSRDCILVSIDIDLETYTTSTFPSLMLDKCKDISMARWKDKYPAIVGFVQDDLHAVVLQDFQNEMPQKKIFKRMKIFKKDLLNHDMDVYSFDDRFIKFKGRNVSCKRDIVKGTGDYRMGKSFPRMPLYPSLVTFKGMKQVNEDF